jgi:pyruvate kinase
LRKVMRKLSMNWGVIPILYEGEPSDCAYIAFAINKVKQLGYLHPGDIVASTTDHHQTAGGTDLIRVITLED